MSNNSKPISSSFKSQKPDYQDITTKQSEGKPKGIPPELLAQTLSHEQKAERLQGSKILPLNSSGTIFKSSKSEDGQWEKFVDMLKSTKKSIQAYLTQWS